MAFVKQVTEAEAGPELKQIYVQVRDKFGFLPNYAQALGRTPQLLAEHMSLGARILSDGALPALVKEQMGVVVSGLNTSSYCIAVHLEFLRRMGIEKPMGRQLAINYPAAPVSENVQALFRFADKLTRRPGDIEKADADALRAAGWDDAAIVEAVLTVAYFNFINRASLGLGLLDDF